MSYPKPILLDKITSLRMLDRMIVEEFDDAFPGQRKAMRRAASSGHKKTRGSPPLPPL